MPPISILDLPAIVDAIRELYRTIEHPPTESWIAPEWLVKQCRQTTMTEVPDRPGHAWLIRSAADEVLNRMMPPWHHSRQDCPEIAESHLDAQHKAVLLELRGRLMAPFLSTHQLAKSSSQRIQFHAYLGSVLQALSHEGVNNLDTRHVAERINQFIEFIDTNVIVRVPALCRQYADERDPRIAFAAHDWMGKAYTESIAIANLVGEYGGITLPIFQFAEHFDRAQPWHDGISTAWCELRPRLRGLAAELRRGRAAMTQPDPSSGAGLPATKKRGTPGRKPLAESADPKEKLKANLYANIRSKMRQLKLGGKALVQELKRDTDLNDLARKAGCIVNTALVKAAMEDERRPRVHAKRTN